MKYEPYKYARPIAWLILPVMLLGGTIGMIIGGSSGQSWGVLGALLLICLACYVFIYRRI